MVNVDMLVFQLDRHPPTDTRQGRGTHTLAQRYICQLAHISPLSPAASAQFCLESDSARGCAAVTQQARVHGFVHQRGR